MKYTLAIAALLAATAQAIQFPTYKDEVDHSGEFFVPNDHKMLGDGGYVRAIPANFVDDSDDIFMRSMYEQYALEAKNKDGSPSGKFWLDEAAARAASKEVLATHKGLTGAELQAYMDTYFAKSWGHFDVNKSGSVEAIRMPQFMRFLCSDQQMTLLP